MTSIRSFCNFRRCRAIQNKLNPMALEDIQFKGSGKTPYSRSGDGRAALGPMLREYIISEAMHSLKIPTTRNNSKDWRVF